MFAHRPRFCRLGCFSSIFHRTYVAGNVHRVCVAPLGARVLCIISKKVLDALLRVIGGGIGEASSRCARRRARVCAPRACVRPALGAHCSISAAGTATPPDWAIHHRRRPRARPPPCGPPRRGVRARARDSRPCARRPRVQVAAALSACSTDALMPRRAQQRSRRIFKTDT